jgi:polar amino acid transport system substrate-binding protein
MSLQSEFAPEGTMRVGINLGNPVIAQRDPQGGEPRGVASDLGRELGKRLGVGIRFVTFESAGKMADAVKEGAWDVAFLAVDPDRAGDIDFSDAYVHIEGTYLVRDDSPLRTVDAVDREGVRIAVGLKTAYDLWLTRNIKHAQLVRSASSEAAVAQFLEEKLDAAAGVRQPLVTAARRNQGLRVMDDAFMVIRQAAGVPRGRATAAKYLVDFIEDAKHSGLVGRLLDNSGVSGASIAPPTAKG